MRTGLLGGILVMQLSACNVCQCINVDDHVVNGEFVELRVVQVVLAEHFGEFQEIMFQRFANVLPENDDVNHLTVGMVLLGVEIRNRVEYLRAHVLAILEELIAQVVNHVVGVLVVVVELVALVLFGAFNDLVDKLLGFEFV